MANEAADAVTKQPVGLALHMVAAATLCARGATSAERELAKRILLEDPSAGKDAPREAESVAGCFNRQMDAAIESCNDSAHEPTRSARRARLATDLGRAGLVLMDRDELVLLLDRGAPARPTLVVAGKSGDGVAEALARGEEPDPIEIDGPYGSSEHDGHDLGAELAGGSTIAIAGTALTNSAPRSSGILGLEFQEGTTFVSHMPSFDVASATSSAYDGDPNVND